ncbi:FG-GAP repeat domain-containing protein [Nocardioides sp. NPDC057772]|uniref:FG-GAP repeat domain-containing protein n=1 Tax=Nocardioides sp. NPDC057772 TaxID=3346245 RepID=UPI00366D67F0
MVGDINSDGYGDAVVEAASLMDFTSDGSVFKMATSSVPTSYPEVLCDFDGDNFPNAIEETRALKGKTVDTYSALDAEGNPIASVKRQREVQGLVVNGVHCGDFDGDGLADLGLEEDIYNHAEMDRAELHEVESMRVRFTVHRQVAPGKLGKPEVWLDTQTPKGEPGNTVFDKRLVVADLNGDTKDDVTLFVNYTTREFMSGGLGAMCGHVAAYSDGKSLQRGPVQKFVYKDRVSSSADDAEIACEAIPADTNGDGVDELVGLDDAGKAAVWSAKGGKWTRTKASTRPPRGGKGRPGVLAGASDVNGDGLTDLFSITGRDQASVMLYAAQPDGTLSAPRKILQLSMKEGNYDVVPTRLKPAE